MFVAPASRSDVASASTVVFAITWFEYAPQDCDAFEELVRKLRRTEEWRYVDREIDIRLTRLTVKRMPVDLSAAD